MAKKVNVEIDQRVIELKVEIDNLRLDLEEVNEIMGLDRIVR